MVKTSCKPRPTLTNAIFFPFVCRRPQAANGARRFSRVRFVCQGEVRLKTGTLSITALFRDVGDGAVTGEVVGGSGAYEGANGSFTSSGGENAVDNFHIVTFSS